MRTNSRPTSGGPASAGAWSGSAFIGAIVIILVVLGVALHELNKIVADADNNPTTSALKTTGAGSPPPMDPSRDIERQGGLQV